MAALAGWLVVAPASATNWRDASFGNCDTHYEPCLTDGVGLIVNYSSMPSQAIGPIQTTLYSSWDTLDLNVSETTSHTSHIPDLWYEDEFIGGGAGGWFYCLYPDPGTEVCDHGHVRLDVDLIEAVADSVGVAHNVAIQKVACHETGHGVGLEHVTHSAANEALFQCMTSGAAALDTPFVGSHNSNHVNVEYP